MASRSGAGGAARLGSGGTVGGLAWTVVTGCSCGVGAMGGAGGAGAGSGEAGVVSGMVGSSVRAGSMAVAGAP